MTLKERITDLCKNKGIPINKLEKDCGFAGGYISKLDKSTPNAAKIQIISEYLDVSIDYLLTGETRSYYLNDDTAKVAQEIFENHELRALFDVQRDMSPDDLRALYAMALALKRKDNN